MEYMVNLIGLGFFEEVGASRTLWMPDGRIPPPDIDAHWASIVIDASAHVSDQGWDPSEVSITAAQREYFFPPSILDFPSTQALVSLDVSQLDDSLISLTDIDPAFALSSNPTYVAQIKIQHGSLAIRTIPSSLPPDQQQYFARWTIPHAGTDPVKDTITIRVTESRGWPERTLEVKPLSEVSIINTSRSGPQPVRPGDHFHLYERLSGVPVTLAEPPTHVPSTPIQPFLSNLPPFTSPMPATGRLGCSPTKL
jgi:hypothetical protein